MNVIFTCGGTGGHINPAIAIANVLKERHPDANILFVGASGEMEENLVPRAGFPIKTVRCAGFSREFNKNGIMWNIKAVGTVRRAVKSCEQIVAEFKPDVIVVDPPRKGLNADTIEALDRMDPRRIVYVSCDPATLA